MRPFAKSFIALIALSSISTLALAQVKPDQSRGDLLYSTHCVTCHTTQVHWRDDKKAYDWDSLKFQVRRWQGNAGLVWSDADITEVSRYLNETIYRYPPLGDAAKQVGQVIVHPADTTAGKKP